jgi:DNA-binding CsgD family transcriptional regulator
MRAYDRRMAGSIVGREAELASLRAFVASVSEGAAALVLEGEAGMGKTTLWSYGVEDARSRGLRVLEARPAESETKFSFSGLGDLLDAVLDEALEPLPAAQKRALSRALVLDDEEGPTPDPHAVGVAVLNALRTLADKAPLLVAVDDVQWLDAASAGALAYGARRLRAERVGLLLARREASEVGLLAELRRSLPADRLSIVGVGPLDSAALHHVVQDHLGVALPRPLLAEVRQASGGNPFYALEIVLMLRRSGTSVEAGQQLPLPESLHDLVRGRLLALPEESRRYLLAAAAHAHPTTAITEAASGIGSHAGLTPALESRIVELDGDRIRFTHPLLAASAYEVADRRLRMETHTRLAVLLEDPEARAWQLAASVVQPDGGVAAALEEAARHARARGAPRPAALLLDRACELTPSAERGEALRRAVDAAFLHFEAGDSPRAETKLRELLATLAPGPERARALVVLARIRLYDAPEEANELFAQVVEEAGDDRTTLAFAHEGVAACSVWMFERFDQALRHTDVALALAEELGDEALAADVLLTRITAETMLGLPAATKTAERALALQESAADRRVLDQPLVSLAEHWTWVDRHDEARAALVHLLERAQDLGDENARPWVLFLLGDVERLLGNLPVALDLARDGLGAAEQSGQPLFVGLNSALESHVQAELGRGQAAREAAQRAVAAGRGRFARIFASAALGHLELALGSPGHAADGLAPAVAFVRDQGIVEPGATRFVIDRVEALVELGRPDSAAELLDWYEGNAARLVRSSAVASCVRCRGLLAACAGRLDEALSAYAQALEWHAKVELPLDRGRTLLALGAAQRRAKRRREARETLEQALEVFERIGAAVWAERARAELRRISGRAPAAGALTPAEERVAALVCEGKTNREVAAALYLSERTIEGHLSRIFGKLGIAHRNQLGPALAVRQTQGESASNTGASPVSADPVAP